MRSLSVLTRQALAAQESGEVLLYLIDLAHDTIPTLYFVKNNELIVHQGNEYVPFPFDLTMPDDTADTISRINLSIDNVDRQIVAAIRSISTPPIITLRFVLASEPNTLLGKAIPCTLRSTVATAGTVTGELWPVKNIADEPYPQHMITPALFPGVFA